MIVSVDSNTSAQFGGNIPSTLWHRCTLRRQVVFLLPPAGSQLTRMWRHHGSSIKQRKYETIHKNRYNSLLPFLFRNVALNFLLKNVFWHQNAFIWRCDAEGLQSELSQGHESVFSVLRGRRPKLKPERRLSASGWRGRNISRKRSRNDWRGRRWGGHTPAAAQRLSHQQQFAHWSLLWQRLEEIMKRTRKSDAGDKVAGLKPILGSINWFFKYKLITFWIFSTHRRRPKLLRRSTARTRTSANVSVPPVKERLTAQVCGIWLIIIAQQLETCRTRLQPRKPLLLPWSTASSPPPTRMASKPTGRKLNLRRSSTETRHRLSPSCHSRLESPSWWRRARWSPSTSQVIRRTERTLMWADVLLIKSGIKSLTGHLQPLTHRKK